jgi:hypothetical protein
MGVDLEDLPCAYAVHAVIDGLGAIVESNHRTSGEALGANGRIAERRDDGSEARTRDDSLRRLREIEGIRIKMAPLESQST